jgi:regulator of sigma E protease
MLGFVQNILVYVVPFLIVLGVVVTVHELGHFLAAKWLGTAIDSFSIGFGRPIASWRDKAGVEWRVGWLPLGGYVKFSGDDNAASVPDQNDLDDMRARISRIEGEGALRRYFHFKPLWQRAIIVAAGPISNFILAIVIFTGLLMILGEPIAPARVDGLKPGSAAERGGFHVGDTVIRADGKRIESFDDLKAVVMLRSDTAVRFVVRRDGREVELTATPERGPMTDQLGKQHQMGQLGIVAARRPQDVTWKTYGPVEALQGGFTRTWGVVDTTVDYLGRLIRGRETAEQLSGPLGMAQLSGDVAKKTAEISSSPQALAINIIITMLELVANISVGIGFINLLPVPVLDGGHLLFYAYESVARRPLAAKVQAAGYRVGLALVLGLMLFATWNDLQRLRVFNLLGGLFS